MPKKVSADFFCPINHTIMQDPVMLVGDGHSYERAAITSWLKDHHTSPMTNNELTVEEMRLVANHTLRKAIQDFQQSAEEELLAGSAFTRPMGGQSKQMYGLDVPSEFICPLSHHIMLEPVSIADGDTFERKNIEAYLDTHNTNPVTSKRLAHKNVVMNLPLQRMIQGFIEHHREDLEKILLQSAKDNQLESVTDLVRLGIDLTITDAQGWTVLHHASFLGYEAMVQFLLKQDVRLVPTATHRLPEIKIFSTEDVDRWILQYSDLSRSQLRVYQLEQQLLKIKQKLLLCDYKDVFGELLCFPSVFFSINRILNGKNERIKQLAAEVGASQQSFNALLEYIPDQVYKLGQESIREGKKMADYPELLKSQAKFRESRTERYYDSTYEKCYCIEQSVGELRAQANLVIQLMHDRWTAIQKEIESAENISQDRRIVSISERWNQLYDAIDLERMEYSNDKKRYKDYRMQSFSESIEHLRYDDPRRNSLVQEREKYKETVIARNIEPYFAIIEEIERLKIALHLECMRERIDIEAQKIDIERQLKQLQSIKSLALVRRIHCVLVDEHATALHLAVLNRQQATVRMLSEMVEIVNVPLETTQRTPLHLAALIGDLESINVLLERGADLRLLDVEGKSAITLAEEFGHEDVANQLKQKMAALARTEMDELRQQMGELMRQNRTLEHQVQALRGVTDAKEQSLKREAARFFNVPQP